MEGDRSRASLLNSILLSILLNSSVPFLNGWSGPTGPTFGWCDSGLQHEQELLPKGNMCVAALLWRPAPSNSMVTHFISHSLSQRMSPLLSSLVQLQPLGEIYLQRVLTFLSFQEISLSPGCTPLPLQS